jgi:hypothetical protein
MVEVNMMASPCLRTCTSSPGVRVTSPSKMRADFSPQDAAGYFSLPPPGAIMSMMGSSLPNSSMRVRASIETGDRVLVSFRRALTRTNPSVKLSVLLGL